MDSSGHWALYGNTGYKPLSSLPNPRFAFTLPEQALPHELVDPVRVLVEVRGRIFGPYSQPAALVMVDDTDAVPVRYLDGRPGRGIPQADHRSGRLMFDSVPLYAGPSYTADGHHRDVVDRICGKVGMLPRFNGQQWVLRQFARFPEAPPSDPGSELLRGQDLILVLRHHPEALTHPTIDDVIATADSSGALEAKTTMFKGHLVGSNLADPEDTVPLWHAQVSLRTPDRYLIREGIEPGEDQRDWMARKLGELGVDAKHIKALLGEKVDGVLHFNATKAEKWAAGEALLELVDLKHRIDPATKQRAEIETRQNPAGWPGFNY